MPIELHLASFLFNRKARQEKNRKGRREKKELLKMKAEIMPSDNY
jgi:hypothetical protein